MKTLVLVVALSALSFGISAKQIQKPDEAFINNAAIAGITQENWDSGKSAKLTMKHAYRFTHSVELSTGEYLHDIGQASGFDLDSVQAHDVDGPHPMSVILRDRLNQESLVILKNGKLVDEYYWNGMNKDATHIQRSITKSFTAMTLATLVEDDKVDMNSPITNYVPELKASPAYANATVQEVSDMRSAIKTNEAESWVLMGSVQEWYGKDTIGQFDSIVDYGATLQARTDVKTGQEYDYQCINTEMLGMVITHVTGKSVGEVMEEKLWKKVGFEHNAHLQTNSKGEAVSSAGLNATGRDVALMMDVLVNDGKNRNGEQVIPKAFIDNLLSGNDEVKDAWGNGKESKMIKNAWYKDQIRVSTVDGHKFISFVGINGQLTVGEPSTGIVFHMNGAQDQTQAQRTVMITFLDVIPTMLSALK